jgi:UDP-glucose 4-epimerase
MKILITGMAGQLGRHVAQFMHHQGHKVIGVDRRPWPDPPKGVEMFQVDIRKRPAEDVFRTRRPDAVIHMATVTHLTAGADERYRINLWGTKAVFDYCHQYGVKQVLFVGRHTCYGAAPDTPLYQSEAEPPAAIATFPALSDLVSADLYAASAIWRYPEIATSVLRICYTLGSGSRGTLASYLKGPRVPTILGFDPLFQFMHDQDAVLAIGLALLAKLRGVFNVAGPPPLPLSVLIQQTGRQNIPLPEFLFPHMMGRLGFPKLPHGASAHIKYPIVVDDHAFRQATGFEQAYDAEHTMEAFRYG